MTAKKIKLNDETIKYKQRINEIKSWVFEKINKRNKLLSQLIERQRDYTN